MKFCIMESISVRDFKIGIEKPAYLEKHIHNEDIIALAAKGIECV